jgi:hypothetical protein
MKYGQKIEHSTDFPFSSIFSKVTDKLRKRRKFHTCAEVPREKRSYWILLYVSFYSLFILKVFLLRFYFKTEVRV